MRYVERIVWLMVVVVGSVHAEPAFAQDNAAPPADLLAAQPNTAAQPNAAGQQPKYPPPADLADALDRALAAVKQAEKKSTDMVDKLDETQFYLREVQKLDAANARGQYIAGRMNIVVGRSRDAFSQIDAYVRTPGGSQDWEAFKLLADLHYDSDYFIQAEQKYEKAAELKPNEASIFVGLCKTAIKRVRRQEAVEYGKRAIQIDPRSSDAWAAYGEALLKNNMLDESKGAVDKAIETTTNQLQADPGNDSILEKLKKRHELLIEILTAMVTREPKTANFYFDLARATQAVAEVERFIAWNKSRRIIVAGVSKTQPATPSYLIYEFARLSELLGMRADAVEALEKYLEANPDDERGRQMLNDLVAANQAPPAAAQP